MLLAEWVGRAYGSAAVAPGMGVPCGNVGASETGAFERGGGVSAPAPTISEGKRVPGMVGLSEFSALWSRSSIRLPEFSLPEFGEPVAERASAPPQRHR